MNSTILKLILHTTKKYIFNYQINSIYFLTYNLFQKVGWFKLLKGSQLINSQRSLAFKHAFYNVVMLRNNAMEDRDHTDRQTDKHRSCLYVLFLQNIWQNL